MIIIGAPRRISHVFVSAPNVAWYKMTWRGTYDPRSYIHQSTPIGSAARIWGVLAAFLVLFWGTTVAIRRRSFFFIRIITFWPTFATLFPLKLCSKFVFDCWKVRAVLLCVLVDVLLIVFQSTGLFFARKNGGLQKSCFCYKLHTIRCHSTIYPTINP